MSENDLDDVGLLFCEMALDSLSVGPRALTPEFDPYVNDYSTMSGLRLVMVTAPIDSDAIVRFLDVNDDEIADADGGVDGHQVEIGYEVTTIKVRIVSADRLAGLTYTITVTYEDLLVRYDVNGDEAIDRDEAIVAIADYFNGAIGRDEAIEVIALYFS